MPEEALNVLAAYIFELGEHETVYRNLPSVFPRILGSVPKLSGGRGEMDDRANYVRGNG